MSQQAATEPPESFDDFQRRLIEIEPHLPKRLRQAAAYALEHPDEFALGTASALARNADVQASTLVRFAQTLGFAGFFRAARAVSLAPAQPLARLFRTPPRTPAERPRRRAATLSIFCSGLPPILPRLRSRACAMASSGASLTQRSVFWPMRRRSIALGQRRSFCVAHYP